MKQYIYRPDECGLKEWPPGVLRLEGIEQTDDPNIADCFVCPGHIRIFEVIKDSGKLDIDKLQRLPYFKGNESRHVFFDCSDNFKQAINLPIIFIRCDVRTWMLPNDPNTIAWPWPVNPIGDLDQCVELPSDGYKYDVSFIGWNSGLVRKVSAMSCKNNPSIKSDITIYPNFYGSSHIEGTPEGIRRRTDFIRSLKESRIILCPESIPGVLPYRFFEAMSAGRYPLLIGRDYTLPLQNLIPYDNFISKIDIDRADDAGDVIAEIRSRHSDRVFIDKGQMARRYWLEFLDGRKWPTMMAKVVTDRLEEIKLLSASVSH